MSSAVSDDDRKESWMDRVDGARAFDVVTRVIEGARGALLVAPTLAAAALLWRSAALAPCVAFVVAAVGAWPLARALERRVWIEYTGSSSIRLVAPAGAALWLLAAGHLVAGVALAAGVAVAWRLRRAMARDTEN
jgi:hypothetical protein